MPRLLSTFHCEKNRLIDQKGHVELWDGAINGKRHILKFFHSPVHQPWSDFQEQSHLHNSTFLRPTLAGYVNKDIFCHAMPADFQPDTISPETDFTTLIVQLLAFFAALEKRGLTPRWEAGHLVKDAFTERIFLAGFQSLRHVENHRNEAALRTIGSLERLGGSYKCAPAVLNVLKKWQRRKGIDLTGCLREMLTEYPYALELLSTSFEWIHTKEIEIAGGLFQLAGRSRGRAVLFAGDRGEGKSTMLKQLYASLAPRDCIVTYLSAENEERPLQSFRALLDSFFENISAYTKHRNLLHPQKLLQLLETPGDACRDEFVSRFISLITRFRQKTKSVFVFCIDDVHLFDALSLKMLSALFARMDSSPFLFLMTSSGALPEFSEKVVTLPLQTGKSIDFERAHTVPLWKPEQHQFYLDQIYNRTAGNPLLFTEFVHQTLRQRQSQLIWDEDFWMFRQPEIPAFPNVLLEFYLQQIPPITAQELSFLELASVQGAIFDPVMCERDPAIRDAILTSLTEKAVVYRSNGRTGFRKPLLSEALLQRIETNKRSRLHSECARELLKYHRPEQTPVIAHHYLKAGEYEQALSFASAAAERPHGTNSLLPIFEELERLSDRLTANQQLMLHLSRGSLYFRRGNYSFAIENYNKALALQSADFQERFPTAMKIVQAYVQNNDIFSAQKLLQEQTLHLTKISDSRLLLDFYLARAFCAWHRGERTSDDFQKAMEIAEKLQDHDALAKGYRQRAELKLKEGGSTDARMLAEKALKHCQKTGNLEEMGHCLRILGCISWRQSKYKTAEQQLKKSLRILQKVENQEGAAHAWSVLGNIYSELYEFAKAVDAFQNASRLFNQERHPYEMSLAQFNLGLVYVEQGNLKEAERIFIRCRLIDKKTGNKRFLAYDLRALALVCMLRGFYKKANRLLKRTLEICIELKAEGDILQTKMFLLLNELEQQNYRQAAPLVQFLEDQLPHQEDEKTQADIFYLAAHYYGFINDSKKAFQYLENAEKIARQIRYFKLIGQCLILKLIFENKIPGRTDLKLKRAINYFRRSRNELEFSNYMLRLYQFYPQLTKFPEHNRRLFRMEALYRNIRNRLKHRSVKHLARKSHPREQLIEPNYDWSRELLEILRSNEPLQERFHSLLSRANEGLRASRGVIRYLNQAAVFEKISAPSFSNIVEDLEETIFRALLEKKEPCLLNIAESSDFRRHPWVILSDVSSVLAIPTIAANQVTGCWYFERHGDVEPFSKKEESKIAFFLMAAMPSFEQALREEAQQNQELTNSASNSHGDFIGQSKPMRELYKQMAKVAPLDISVLIHGESGTGKELVARTLHRNSNRSREPFLALNCSALPETLIESELFGYNRGAFTGANSNKIGFIERANGGTLFLDEIGDLSIAAQAKLLRVLQEREIQRLGDTAVRKVNVRFLFATHKDLKRLVKEGSYREDLLYRISVYSLTVPSLRDHKEDVPLLLRHFMAKYSQNFAKQQIQFAPAAIRALCEYRWPGNVREIENVVQMLLVNADTGAIIEVTDLPSHLVANDGLQNFHGKSLEEARREFEKGFLLAVLKKNGWNKTHAAKELKLTRQGLVNLLNRLEITDVDR